MIGQDTDQINRGKARRALTRPPQSPPKGPSGSPAARLHQQGRTPRCRRPAGFDALAALGNASQANDTRWIRCVGSPRAGGDHDDDGDRQIPDVLLMREPLVPRDEDTEPVARSSSATGCSLVTVGRAHDSRWLVVGATLFATLCFAHEDPQDGLTVRGIPQPNTRGSRQLQRGPSRASTVAALGTKEVGGRSNACSRNSPSRLCGTVSGRPTSTVAVSRR